MEQENQIERAADMIDGGLSHLVPYIEAANKTLTTYTGLEFAICFLAGALSVATGARLAILGAAIALVVGLAPELELPLSEFTQTSLTTLSVFLIFAGALQGLVTTFLGEEAAPQVLGLMAFGALIFLVWRGPARLLRTISGIWGSR